MFQFLWKDMTSHHGIYKQSQRLHKPTVVESEDQGAIARDGVPRGKCFALGGGKPACWPSLTLAARPRNGLYVWLGQFLGLTMPIHHRGSGENADCCSLGMEWGLRFCVFNSPLMLLSVGRTLSGKTLGCVCKIKELGHRASTISEYAWVLRFFFPLEPTLLELYLIQFAFLKKFISLKHLSEIGTHWRPRKCSSRPLEGEEVYSWICNVSQRY